MSTVVYMLLGAFSFASGSGILGVWLRKHPSTQNAERSSRIVQFLFFAGLVAPGAVAVLHPGLSHFDEKVGLRPLPAKRFFRIAGILLALPGFYLLGSSLQLLRKLGRGANAFRLTKHLALDDLYERTRNPMSLGSYLIWLGTGLSAGSSFLTLVALFVMIPAHLFCLRYFEEEELELRFGDPYRAYRQRVPFLFPRMDIGRRQESKEVRETGNPV